MASRSLGTLTLDLVAKTGGYVAGLSKSERETEKWRRKVESNLKAVGTAVGTGLALAATVATAALTRMVRTSLEAIDAQAKLAQRMHTSYESISNLARAGDLAGVSMQQIEVASRSLDINLGKAAQGSIAQAEALARLKLNADEVSKLPLDERIKAINTALVENISQTERAAVAADLFGSRGAAAIQMLDPATIEEAARQVQIFGLNLSDVDASKVEMAGDALSNFGLLSEGVSRQLTVELAPVLEDVGNEFLSAAEAAGGLGTVVRDMVRGAVTDIGALLNVVDKIGLTLDKVNYQVALAGSATRLAFTGSASAQAEVEAYTAKIREIGAAIADVNSDTLLGNQLITYYKNVQEAAQSAAEASAAAKAAAPDPEGSDPEAEARSKAAQKQAEKAAKAAERQAKAIADSISALQFEADTVGKTADETKLLELALDGASESQLNQASAALKTIAAFEASTKAQKDYKALLKDLRTDEEVLTDQLNDRLAVLNAITNVTDKQKIQGRIAAESLGIKDGKTDAPQYAGLDAVVGGAFGEISKIDEAQKELEKWYAKKLELLSENRAAHAELNAQWDEQEKVLAQAHADELLKIEKARALAAYAASEEIFSSLAGLTKQFAGEQSTAYRVLFAAEKAAAIARSIVAIQTAIAQASTSGPFPANLAAMASVAAQTASIVATISSTAIAGQAHDGLMSVPKTGTYLLEKGERVTTEKTSAKLDRAIEEAKLNQQAVAAGPVNLRVVNAFDDGAVVGGYLGSKAGEKAVMNIVQRNRRTIQSLTL